MLINPSKPSARPTWPFETSRSLFTKGHISYIRSSVYVPRLIISATEGTFVEIESIHFWLS